MPWQATKHGNARVRCACRLLGGHRPASPAHAASAISGRGGAHTASPARHSWRCARGGADVCHRAMLEGCRRRAQGQGSPSLRCHGWPERLTVCLCLCEVAAPCALPLGRINAKEVGVRSETKTGRRTDGPRRTGQADKRGRRRETPAGELARWAEGSFRSPATKACGCRGKKGGSAVALHCGAPLLNPCKGAPPCASHLGPTMGFHDGAPLLGLRYWGSATGLR